ncbi:hypothetical protein ENBRE01_0126 [Enteropsectra breve]|nr:hypothetical protein ENBRE01_0126 [Enteropsectra breve]
MFKEQPFISMINDFFDTTAEVLHLPTYTVATAQIMFQFVLARLSRYHLPKAIACSCLSLAAKATENKIKPQIFLEETGYAANPELELEILELLNYKCEFFDLHRYVVEVCNYLGFSPDDKLENLNKIYKTSLLNKIGFITDGYEISEFGMCVFGDSEIEKIDSVFCKRTNMKNIEKIRKALF